MNKQILIALTLVVSATSPFPTQAQETSDANIKKITKAPVTEKTEGEVTADLGSSEIKVLPTEAVPAAAEREPANETAAAATPKPKEEKKAEPVGDTKSRAEAKGVPAETALRWLTNGNVRFTTKAFRKDGRSGDDRKRVSTNQRPHAIVLSCSDSRLPPEIVFDQALGEIVTVRVAGPALDNTVIASIEEALENLDPHLLVVMGHDKCSTIESALKVKDGTHVVSANFGQTLSDIRLRLKTIAPDKLSPNFEVESAVNADGVGRELLKRSELIRKKVETGDLVIKPALYHLDSGKVSFY